MNYQEIVYSSSPSVKKFFWGGEPRSRILPGGGDFTGTSEGARKRRKRSQGIAGRRQEEKQADYLNKLKDTQKK